MLQLDSPDSRDHTRRAKMGPQHNLRQGGTKKSLSENPRQIRTVSNLLVRPQGKPVPGCCNRADHEKEKLC